MTATEIPLTLAQSLPSLDADTVVTLGLASMVIGGIVIALRVRQWIDDGNISLARTLRKEWSEALGPVRESVQGNKSAINMLERQQSDTEKKQLREFATNERVLALEQRIDSSIQRIETALTESRRERDAKLDRISDTLTEVLLRVGSDNHGRPHE